MLTCLRPSSPLASRTSASISGFQVARVRIAARAWRAGSVCLPTISESLALSVRTCSNDWVRAATSGSPHLLRDVRRHVLRLYGGSRSAAVRTGAMLLVQASRALVFCSCFRSS